MRGLAVWVAAGLSVASGAAGAQAADARVPLGGVVVDATGDPLVNVVVFAFDDGDGKVNASTRTDRSGRFTLDVPPRKHRIGVASSLFRIYAYEEVEDSRLRVVLTADVKAINADTVRAAMQGPAVTLASGGDETRTREADERPAAPRPALAAPSPHVAGLLQGRVTDEAGVALGGVVIVAVDPRTRLVKETVTTDANGRYELALPPGEHRVSPVAAGLRLASTNRSARSIDFVLAIDARPQTVEVVPGHVLRFRLDDSIWPEYVPPPAVRMWLYYAYGITPEFYSRCSLAFARAVQPLCPASVWVRVNSLPKWWWLRQIQRPPNTARVGGLIRDQPQRDTPGSPTPPIERGR